MADLNVNVGDEVAIFTNYGRNSVVGVVTDADKYGFNLDDGSSYSSWEKGLKYEVVKTDSELYREAVRMHRARVIIDIIRAKDAANNSAILDALVACADALGEDEVNERHRVLCVMGASVSEGESIYRALSYKK